MHVLDETIEEVKVLRLLDGLTIMVEARVNMLQPLQYFLIIDRQIDDIRLH